MKKRPPHLQIWTAVTLEELPPYGDLTEARIAAALRNIAAENKRLGHHAFLVELAHALDNPDSAWRLRLTRSERGKPADVDARLNRAMLLGPLVKELVDAGWKKEAAVQQAMSQLGWSRAQVMRGLSDWTRLQKPLKA